MPALTDSRQATEQSTAQILREIADRFATPCYAYDLRTLRIQADKLRAHLPAETELFYSLKANASLGISETLAEYGLGADVASAGELATAIRAGFAAERIFVAGPYKSPEAIAMLREHPAAIVSMDSPSELEWLHSHGLVNQAVLRLRPDFDSTAVVVAGRDSRFGFLLDQLSGLRRQIAASNLPVIGFHIFAGSQVLRCEGVLGHFRAARALAERAAAALEISPSFVNLGGGFGVPYGRDEPELELAPIGRELSAFCQRAPGIRFALELGRFLVAQAGWYLTSVVGHQTLRGQPAVVVDGGTHQRADLCGLCLKTKAAPPLALDCESTTLVPTEVLGCLSLPEDILAQSALLPPLQVGDRLAFANAGAYGQWASAVNFHAFPAPTEVAFDGTSLKVMRRGRPAAAILDDQLMLADQLDAT